MKLQNLTIIEIAPAYEKNFITKENKPGVWKTQRIVARSVGGDTYICQPTLKNLADGCTSAVGEKIDVDFTHAKYEFDRASYCATLSKNLVITKSTSNLKD